MVNVKQNESLFGRIWVVNSKERLLAFGSWPPGSITNSL